MRRPRVLPRGVMAAAAAVATVAGVIGLVSATDGSTLLLGIESALGDPEGLIIAVGAFALAFVLRTWAWQRTLPDLTFGHAWSGIHVALGGNHVLPFRLGEALRVLSVVRRAGADPTDAAASTVALRSADLLSLLCLGAVAGPATITGRLGPAGVVLGLVLLVVTAVTWRVLVRRGRSGARVTPPGLAVVVLTTGAWTLEGVLLWRVLGWFDISLGPAETMVVLAAAVSAQVIAVAPGGLGTYEVAATAALLAVGVPATVGLPASLAVHGLKTLYSVGTGALALVVPAPGLFGRLRLPRALPERPTVRPADGPIVFFLPAHDEGPRVAAVIRRAPTAIRGIPVEVVVVDDGSTDDTHTRAVTAGAEVIVHPHNRGLGAAVRTGLTHATRRRARAVVFCDADGEYDPSQLHRLLDPVLDGTADYVVGSRFDGVISHMRPHRRVGNQILTRWVAWTVRQPVTDGQSGYRAFSPAAAADAVVAHDYNYAQVLTIDLIARGYHYAEVPITYRFRASGQSFVRLGHYLRRVVPAVWRQVNSRPQPVAR